MTLDFRELVDANLSGRPVGVCSICSTERFVLEAAMQQAARDGTSVLIESTCNQVNQLGGYTGMTPAGFAAYAGSLAAAAGLPAGRVTLGGDHLGPHVWRREPAEAAMAKACELVREYVLAGYTKVHLDASMRLAGDPGAEDEPLDEGLVVERTVELCRAAEEARAALPAATPAPVYVIGTEVPVPGGEVSGQSAPAVTRLEDLERTLSATHEAFAAAGLGAAWQRVVAVVVQPGVEFGDTVVFDYERRHATALADFLETGRRLVYEAHSTDYQTPASLRRMVEDHFAILKVGPALTFAMREALFALECIERELLGSDGDPSKLRETLDAAMVAHPEHWRAHYTGGDDELRFARAFSYSDRCRYYWPVPEVQGALARLLRNLSARPIPQSLLSQYLPAQGTAVRAGTVRGEPAELVRHHIGEVLSGYAHACRGEWG